MKREIKENLIENRVSKGLTQAAYVLVGRIACTLEA